jgi:hypothetical protein
MVNERSRIEQLLRKKQTEVVTLEEKLKAAKAYINALRDVLKVTSGEASESEPRLKEGSSVAMAREAILARGEPVRLDDLLLSIGKEATQASRSSLAGSLAAYVRRNEIFTRPAPNTFGLIELGHDTQEQEEDDEPPAGFGRAPVAASYDTDLDDDVPF